MRHTLLSFYCFNQNGQHHIYWFFIIILYYTLIDIFRNLRAFKIFNWFLKTNILAVKTLQICLLAPSIRHIISQNFIQFSSFNFSDSDAQGKKFKYFLRSIKQAVYRITFKLVGFLIPRRISRFCFDSKLTGRVIQSQPCNNIFHVYMVHTFHFIRQKLKLV